MKTIPVYRKGELNRVLVDDDIFLVYALKSLYVSPDGYVHVSNVKGTDSFHRIIVNCPEGMVVDHINHNKLDNRRENLRICTHSDNSRNRICKTNKTGFVGVYKTEYDRYEATIGSDFYHIGMFLSAEEAALAYNREAKLRGYLVFNPVTEDQVAEIIAKRPKYLKVNPKSTNPNGYRGVTAFKGYYQSRILKDGHSYFLGYFDNTLDAAKAYDEKAVEFGIRLINFPEDYN